MDELGLPTVMHPEGIAPGQFPTSPLLQGGTVPVNRVPQRPVPGFKPTAVAGAAPDPASDDPSKDPKYIAAMGKAGEMEGKAEEEMDPYVKELHSFMSSPPPPEAPLPRSAAPQFADFAKQASPMLMILTALGGKAAGLSGQNMLGALTGIVEGTSEGNRERYDEAYKAWQDNYKSVQEDWRNKMEVYTQNMAWRKGKIGAEADAVAAYRTMAGDYRQDAKNIAAEHTAYERAMQQLNLQNARLAKLNTDMTGKSLSMRLKAMEQVDKAESGLTRLNQANDAVQDSITLLPRLVDRYKKENGDKINVPGNWARFLEAMSTDPELGEFVGNIKSLKAALVGIDMPAGTRGNLFLNKLFSGTAPEILTDSAAEIQTKLQRDANVIGEALRRSQNRLDTWRNQAMELGAADYGAQPDPRAGAAPESKLPAHKGKTYTDKDVEDTMAANPGMKREDVIREVEAAGFTKATP